MSMRFIVPALLVALGACAANPDAGGVPSTSPGAAARTSDRANLYREAVLRSERLGRAIFEKDIATALATKLLLDAGYLANEPDIRGWVTQEGEGSFLVTYVAERGGRRMVGHEVAFPGGLTGTPTLAPTPPETPLVGERAVMYEARNTGVSEMPGVCDTNYNTVVLPANLIGEQGWLVYQLAATMNPGERVLAGHGLVRVSADGLISLGATPLSLSCEIVPIGVVPAGTEQSGVSVTHVTTAWPLETHVYMSLSYDVPIYVQTSAGTWIVNNGRITLTDLTAER